MPSQLVEDQSDAIQFIANAIQGAGISRVTLSMLEEAAIRLALQEHDGNRTHAARSLGISVRTLQRKLKEHARHAKIDNKYAQAMSESGVILR
jgi:DNA-binding NtrC family response regulator